MFWLIGIVFFLLCFPIIKFVVKQLIFAHTLQRSVQKKQYEFYPLKKMWMFGTVRSSRCNFCIIAPEKVYCVKIVSVPLKLVYVGFCSNPEYYAYKNLNFCNAATFHAVKFKFRKKEPYDFKIPQQYNNRSVENIVVMYPACDPVRTFSGNHTKIIGNGDNCGEAVFYTKNGFLKEINHQKM